MQCDVCFYKHCSRCHKVRGHVNTYGLIDDRFFLQRFLHLCRPCFHTYAQSRLDSMWRAVTNVKRSH